MQGSAVSLVEKTTALIESGVAPDLIFATDMVNLPAFLGLTRDCLSDVPVVLFMHENQLTYPLREGDQRDFTYAWINYISCLAADQIVFNSDFHRTEFLDALPLFLNAFPDYRHSGNAGKIRNRSTVLHLGIELESLDCETSNAAIASSKSSEDVLAILWNQRWEYDRNPSAFFRLVDRLDEAECDFALILAGEQFEEVPAEFRQAIQRHKDRIVHCGFLEHRADYVSMLRRADFVVSTSTHEFFGVAIQEAIHCGCHPLLPNRLSYPELIPKALRTSPRHAGILYDDDDELFEIAQSILTGEKQRLDEAELRQITTPFDWRRQAPKFDDLIEAVWMQRAEDPVGSGEAPA